MTVSEKPHRSRRLSEATMWERFSAGDASYDGHFITGVMTTGIYCIPSCRARKPLRQNVRFFPDVAAARAEGFRACRKCHPDDFERGMDAVRETIEKVVADVRGDPGKFPDSRAVVRHSGYGSTRFFELLRRHYHLTPAELLLRARLKRACSALANTNDDLLEIINAVGFGSSSAFHEQFKSRLGMTPDTYRRLEDSREFDVSLPADFRWDYLRRFLARDSESPSLRLEGDRFSVALHLKGTTGVIHVAVQPGRFRVRSDALSPRLAHAWLIRLAGFDQDTEGFERHARKLGLSRLVKDTRGMRLPQEGSLFEALVWAILGQQITVSFATILRRRVIQQCGFPTEEGLIAHPTPERFAAVPIDVWLPLQISRQKSRYLHALCQAVVSGTLNLDTLEAASATTVERTLLAQDGLGPWTVNYVMMRALGFMDCVPYGDTGVTSGLQALFKTEIRPDVDETRRRLAPFSPFRSLAVAHLWQYKYKNK